MKSSAVVSVLVAVLLGGCAAGSQETSTPMPSASSAVDATIDPATATPLREGADFEVIGELPATVDGSPTYWSAADAKGSVFGQIMVPDPQADPGSMGEVGYYAQPIMVDAASNKLTRLTPVRDSGRTMQIIGADVDDTWIIWLESGDAHIGSGRWKLYSYERATKKVRLLGSYKDPVAGTDSTLDYEGKPEIVGSDVVMSITSDKGSDRRNSILSAPLDGSKPLAVLIDGAVDPDADDGGFSYVQDAKDLMYRDARTGESKRIRAGDGQCQFYRAGVLLTCGKKAGRTEITVSTSERPTVYGPFDSRAGYFVLKGGWATLVDHPDEAAKTYAINIATSKIYLASKSQVGWDLLGHGFASVRPSGKDTAGSKLIKLR